MGYMLKVLDFSATWCPPCQAMVPVIEELKEELQDKVIFEEIDVDENRGEAQEFTIMGVPTFVLMKDGEELDRKTGRVTKEEFKAWVEKYLR
ncbi:thioredoxin family protein [Patescibacteria group bacterium]|nr:thioredoxin family protein [Patescibacteria group bacterium]MBU1868482.1 thioredoxin family protein [Patescibacteria group bacterium]